MRILIMAFSIAMHPKENASGRSCRYGSVFLLRKKKISTGTGNPNGKQQNPHSVHLRMVF